MLKRTVLFCLSLLVLVISGCGIGGNSVGSEGSSHPLRIVTTIAPLYSLASNLTRGTDAVIVNIVSPGVSVHGFALKPRQMQAFEQADVLVINGLGLDGYLIDGVDLTSTVVVDSSRGVDLLKIGSEGDENGVDPHIWLDPENATLQAKNIMEALVKRDPENKALYVKNFENLRTRLMDLKKEIQGRLDALDIGEFIVFHDAYNYFNRGFGLERLAAIEEFPGKEPSQRFLKDLTDLIHEKNVKVLFTEPQFDPKLVTFISDELGISVAELDPLGKDVSENGYFEMMDSNATTFERAFK